MHNDNWDDLRYILAVADLGSVSAASRALGVNHTTVLRRVSAFETRHGAPVFERTQKGYFVRPEQRPLIEAARAVAAGFEEIGDLVVGSRAGKRAVIRVTSTDTFTGSVLPDILTHPDIERLGATIELLTSSAHADFARFQADIAVRPADAIPADMVGDIAAHLGFAIYGRSFDDEAPWLGASGRVARTAVAPWLSARIGSDDVAASADSFMTLSRMVASGLGKALLPCILGDSAPGVVRLETPDDLPLVPIWVASHEDVADMPKFKRLRRVLFEGLEARAAELSGR